MSRRGLHGGQREASVWLALRRSSRNAAVAAAPSGLAEQVMTEGITAGPSPLGAVALEWHRPLALGCGLLLLSACGGGRQTGEEVADLLAAGQASVASFDFDEARELYSKVGDKAAERSPEWAAALYGRAICLWHDSPPSERQIAEAVGLLETIIKEASDAGQVARSHLALGRIYEVQDYAKDEPDFGEARRHYQAALERAGESELADEAMLRLAGSHVADGFEEASIRLGSEILRDWVENKRPQSEYASIMWLYLGEVYLIHLDEPRKALEAYINADAIGLYGGIKRGDFYWKIASLARSEPDMLGVAGAYYSRIIEQEPRSGWAWQAKVELQRLRDDASLMEELQDQ